MRTILSVFFQGLLMFAFFTSTASIVQAGGNHGGSGGGGAKPKAVDSPSTSSIADSQAESANDRSTKGKLLRVLYVDGYELSVKIVDAKDSIPDGGTHNILVKVKLGPQIKRNGIVEVSVLFPDATRKTKTLLELGDWYLAGYDMGHEGIHHIKVSFKSNKGGEAHRTDFFYP